MPNLSSLFTPTKARSYLLDTFIDSPQVTAKVNEMTNKQLQFFAVLVSGYTVSEVGRGLPVDVEDTCVQGRATELINKYSLPIQRPRIEVVNDNGDETKRTIYYVNRGDVELLKCPTQSVQVLKAVKRQSCISQTIAENHDLRRVIKKRGRNVATMRMMTVDIDASPTTKRKLKAEIDDLITRYKLDKAS